jgi:hypothetical protein
MAAVLLAMVAFVSFSRYQKVSDSAAAKVVVEKPEPSATPKATPARWSPSDPSALATPIPMDQTMMGRAMPTPVPWSPPNPGKTTTVIYPGFTVVYSPTLGSPLAVQYAMVQGAKPKIYPAPAKVVTPNPRLIPAAGYARGPMAFPKSIALYFGKAAGMNTNLMTNVAAFDPGTLAGPWNELAELELRYASEYKWIEIVAGPIFSDPPTKVGGVLVPAAFFRVYRRAYGDSMAFIVPQGATSTKMETYLTSISAVEAATGVSIFTNTVPIDARDLTAEAVW